MRGVRDRLLARTEADRLSAGAGGHPITWRGRAAPRRRELAGPVVTGKRVGTHLTRARESARVGPGAGPSKKGASVGRRCGSRIVVAFRGHRPSHAGAVPEPQGTANITGLLPGRPRAAAQRSPAPCCGSTSTAGPLERLAKRADSATRRNLNLACIGLELAGRWPDAPRTSSTGEPRRPTATPTQPRHALRLRSSHSVCGQARHRHGMQFLPFRQTKRRQSH